MTRSFTPTALDLFCGVGGMSLGFMQAGFNVIAAVDYDSLAIDSYASNFPGVRVLRADLSRIRCDVLGRHLDLKRGSLDVVFGGPPCQGFSLIGKRDENDHRNSMLRHFARIVNYFQPRYFVVENVSGILYGHSRSILVDFCKRVQSGGYSLVDPIRSLDATDFAVPQRRHRVFVIGYRSGEVAPSYPNKSPMIDQNRNEFFPTVADAIGDLPEVNQYDYLIDSDRFKDRLGAPSHYARIMRGEILDVGMRKVVPVRKHEGLGGCARTIHTARTTQRFSELSQGEVDRTSRATRLRADGVAPTLRAGTRRDHGSYTALRPIHPFTARYITVRESARLHAFPDSFEFHPTKWHALMQIGNSVPPRFARCVAAQILEAISSKRN